MKCVSNRDAFRRFPPKVRLKAVSDILAPFTLYVDIAYLLIMYAAP